VEVYAGSGNLYLWTSEKTPIFHNRARHFRNKQTETDKQTTITTITEIGGKAKKQTNGKQTSIETNKRPKTRKQTTTNQTNKQTKKKHAQQKRPVDRQTDRQTDKQTDKQTRKNNKASKQASKQTRKQASSKQVGRQRIETER